MDTGRMTSAGGPDARPQTHEKPTYKSYKKKYRKMRIQFEQKMSENQHNYRAEDRAAETARRLAVENDRLLELLLDINSQSQLPPLLRFDLSLPDDVDALPDKGPHRAIICPTPEGRHIAASVTEILDRRRAAQAVEHSAKPGKSLHDLLAQRPAVPREGLTEEQIHDLKHPMAYLSQDQLDEAANSLDASLGFEVHPALQKPGAFPRKLTDKELETQNPSSVYSWLRFNEPQVFLQDSEEGTTASGKTNSRAAGKRASGATAAILKGGDGRAGSALPSLEDDEIDSEGNFVVHSASASKKGGKRKRMGDDDVGYRPKGGSRPAKKKKNDASGSRKSAGATRKKGEKIEAPGESVLDMAE